MFTVLVRIFPRIFMNHGVKWTHRYLIEPEPFHVSIVNVGKKLQYLQYQIGSSEVNTGKFLDLLCCENTYTFSHPKKTHSLIAHNIKCPGFIPIHWRNYKNINQKWGLKKIRVLCTTSKFVGGFFCIVNTVSDIVHGIPFINTFNFYFPFQVSKLRSLIW